MIRVLAVVMARMGSTRLPNKVLKKIREKTIIQILLSRLSLAKNIDKVILATSDNKEDDILAQHGSELGYDVFRGSEEDVLARYYHACEIYNPKSIMRITGDCPLIDYQVVDKLIENFWKYKVDYASNINPPTYADGLDAEIFTYETLKTTYVEAKSKEEREHVTPYMRSNIKFSKYNLENEIDFSNERWTLDEYQDYIVIKNIINEFYPSFDFTFKNILELKEKKSELFKYNLKITRNEGSLINRGQKLYKRAKQIIPGGTMLLSKRPEMFLPLQWPAYFTKAKGCKIWDLEGIEYTDMSIMGIGTNILGYAHPEIDEHVKSVIDKGNMSTLNCPEEVELAEQLISLHPWADKVRFARTGGEANAISIRIARAYSSNDKVAICGYHGWHDWYLSANINDNSNLNSHLLNGLSPKGVPECLGNTVFPFEYNKFDELEKLVNKENIGIIKMEVSRTFKPKEGYLESIRELANKKGIVLIFDECTSGFRETHGGLHKKFNVEPDIMMLGKALGNGYAITAVLGRESIMNRAEETFISSTFWTERIGPCASLKTLGIMFREKSWVKITKMGNYISKEWEKLANKHNLKIITYGLPALINFKINSTNWLKYKTLVTQEMLKKGYLAANSVYVCTEHTKEVIDEYIDCLDSTFALIAECENGRDINKLLSGPVCHDGFRRLN